VRHCAGQRGFTLIEIMIVVLIIAVLMAIAIPNLMHARQSARARACVSNLREIDQAKEQFAMERAKKSGDAIAWGDIVPSYLKTQPACPLGAAYAIGTVGEKPTCPSPDHLLP
jgi:prepilin-type N-terminal cleavage/methylation domain-containing protein